MPENYTPAAAATGTWTEEEIRHQPRAWNFTVLLPFLRLPT